MASDLLHEHRSEWENIVTILMERSRKLPAIFHKSTTRIKAVTVDELIFNRVLQFITHWCRWLANRLN